MKIKVHSLTKIAIRIANRVGRPLGINPFPRAFENEHSERVPNPGQVFDIIYEKNFWGSEESRSGVGSAGEFARRYGLRLQHFLEKHSLSGIFDAPCGDLKWMNRLIESGSISYSGGDISRHVIEDAKRKHPGADIAVFDITTNHFPAADVWHCRDCLFHLPFAAIFAALRNFVSSDVPFALLTTHRARLFHRNLDVGFGGFRFLDLERAPFNLPPPIDRIDDYIKGVEFPRFVCLWSREQIANAVSGNSPEHTWRHE